MNTLKTFAITMIAVTLGTQNPSVALINKPVSHHNVVFIAPKQPDLIANDVTYSTAQGDTQIWMPGRITEKKPEQLFSESPTTQTVYFILYVDLPKETEYLSTLGLRKIMQDEFRKKFSGKQELSGKVVRSTDLVIEGYPGTEFLVQHSNGALGQYQSFIVKRRMYFLGAVAPGELTTEAANFFASFRVYPEQIRYPVERTPAKQVMGKVPQLTSFGYKSKGTTIPEMSDCLRQS
ncbi:hypothetical protein HW132_30645 [Brasilonema sp. CT11]|nr:hypothetical protein [Brasilonema sp. CT11]